MFVIYRLGMIASRQMCTCRVDSSALVTNSTNKLENNLNCCGTLEESNLFIDDIITVNSQSDTDCEIISEDINKTPLLSPNSSISKSKISSISSGKFSPNITQITPKKLLKQVTIISCFINITKINSSSHLSTNISHQKRAYTSFNSTRLANKYAKYSTDETLRNESELSVLTKQKKQCPEYKRIPNTNFTVDAFSYGLIHGCTCYFLTHFHSDHYMGLTKKFCQQLYCTQTTAKLVTQCIQVNSSFINCLEFNKEYTIDNVRVTLIEANHCPGSAMILFKLASGEYYLHTGDFRANQSMLQHPILVGHKIDKLFLDTTYCKPRYTFPTQEDVIQYTVQLCVQFIQTNPQGKIFVGSYIVGKEKIYLAIAEALDWKICVSDRKLSIQNCFEWKELQARLTTDTKTTALHVVSMHCLSWRAIFKLKNQFDDDTAILALKPTGWSFTKRNLSDIKPRKCNNILIYDIPYSEHSSYNELKRFVKLLKPAQIIPTVNIEQNEYMSDIFKLWTSYTSF